MAFFDNLKEKAVSTFNQVLDRKSDLGLTKDQLFCREFNLPEGERVLSELAVEVSYRPEAAKEVYKNGNYPQGKLYLTPHFLVFRDVFDRRNCSFTLHLSTIKKVERLPTSSYGFALALSTHSRIYIKLYLVGLRSDSERFSSQLKTALRNNLPNVKQLHPFIQTCYSEYLLAKNKVSTEKVESISEFLNPQWGHSKDMTIISRKNGIRVKSMRVTPFLWQFIHMDSTSCTGCPSTSAAPVSLTELSIF